MSDERQPLFSRRATGLLLALGALSLVAAIAGALLTRYPTDSNQGDSLSRSAIGHRAFVEILQATGQSVLVSRWDSGTRAKSGLLIVAEPDLSKKGAAARFTRMLGQAHSSLVVLPKRHGTGDTSRPGWISHHDTVDADLVSEVLAAIGTAGSGWVTRPPRPTAIELADTSITDATPILSSGQLLRAGNFEPVIATVAGDILLARVVDAPEPGGRFVLSDPDLIATHGLNEPDNARFIVDVISSLTPTDGVVVIDEVLHQFEVSPSLMRELTTFPLVLLTIQIALLGMATVWAGLGRFGAPIEDTRALGPGKDALLDNTAELLFHGGHERHAVDRYVKMTVEQVSHGLHAPSGLGTDQLLEWLFQISRSRGSHVDPRAAVTRANEATSPNELLEAARALCRWKMEVLHGPDPNRRT